ncbi:MAG: hypothetical protein ACJA1L_000535 [Paracoccaceae bacterium]|jgi:hypothetical protein
MSDYKGATYPLRLTCRSDLRAFFDSSEIADGAPRDLSKDQDALFQNMTRAYFRAPGLHPGFFQLGYGKTLDSWKGIVICLEKAEADIPE